jgi:hypothetical protein
MAMMYVARRIVVHGTPKIVGHGAPMIAGSRLKDYIIIVFLSGHVFVVVLTMCVTTCNTQKHELIDGKFT